MLQNHVIAELENSKRRLKLWVIERTASSEKICEIGCWNKSSLFSKIQYLAIIFQQVCRKIVQFNWSSLRLRLNHCGGFPTHVFLVVSSLSEQTQSIKLLGAWGPISHGRELCAKSICMMMITDAETFCSVKIQFIFLIWCDTGREAHPQCLRVWKPVKMFHIITYYFTGKY